MTSYTWKRVYEYFEIAKSERKTTRHHDLLVLLFDHLIHVYKVWTLRTPSLGDLVYRLHRHKLLQYCTDQVSYEKNYIIMSTDVY